MYQDVAVCLCALDPGGDRVDLKIYVITSDVRRTALAMTCLPMRRLVDRYSLFCAKNSMLLQQMMRPVQEEHERYRAFQNRHTGVTWPLRRYVHPLMALTAEEVYILTVVEFLPVECLNAIYATLEAGGWPQNRRQS
jgi:hypothetical protein